MMDGYKFEFLKSSFLSTATLFHWIWYYILRASALMKTWLLKLYYQTTQINFLWSLQKLCCWYGLHNINSFLILISIFAQQIKHTKRPINVSRYFASKQCVLYNTSFMHFSFSSFPFSYIMALFLKHFVDPWVLLYHEAMIYYHRISLSFLKVLFDSKLPFFIF